MKKKQTKKSYLSSPSAIEVIDLDSVGEVSKIEVTMNGALLPLKIGDKIAFPEDDIILKTVAAIQINENGQATYLLEWYDDDSFKQYWISMTELKLLKDRIIQKKVFGLAQETSKKED